jgi:hypothetical protein
MRPSLIFSFLIVLAASCKKDPDPVIPPVQEPVPLFLLEASQGSYFIYEWYQVDSLGNETSLSITDTVYFSGDTIINGNSYAIQAGTYFGSPRVAFIRDSLGYIVTSSGNILFSYVNNSDTLRNVSNSMNDIYMMTKKNNAAITTVAGSFTTYDQQVHYYRADGTPMTNCDSVWISHSHYDDLSGIEVSSQLAFLNPLENLCQYNERRLVYVYIAPE